MACNEATLSIFVCKDLMAERIEGADVAGAGGIQDDEMNSEHEMTLVLNTAEENFYLLVKECKHFCAFFPIVK